MKRILLLISFIFSFSAFSQKIQKPYENISQHYLIKFENDSIVNFSEFPRHMSPTFSKNLKYEKKGDDIKIFLNGFYDFEKKIFYLQDKDFLVLKCKNEILLNDENKMIFILYEKKKPFYITFWIDGKEYKMQMYRSNSYGLLEGNPKENIELDNKLKTIQNNIKEYIFKNFSGYDAYKKYGEKYINGIIIIDKK